MLSIFNGLRDLTFWSVLLRMGLATLCGALIGLERSAKNRPAGFRTHILVCVAAATATLTSLYLYLSLNLPADISRISGQVITGLGFIGAGTIVVTRKMSIKGLTTAAGLWTTGIIGLAFGSGYYELGILGTAFVLLIETWLAQLGGNIQGSPQYVIEVLYSEKTSLDQVLRLCKDKRLIIENLKIHSLEEGPSAYAAQVTLRGAAHQEELLGQIHSMPGIDAAVFL